MEGAQRSYRQAIQIQERLNREHPSVVEFQQDLAKSYTDLGVLLAATNKQEAAQSYQHAVDILEPSDARSSTQSSHFSKIWPEATAFSARSRSSPA